MRKKERHQLIKKMITEEKLATQKDIQDAHDLVSRPARDRLDQG